MREFKFRGISKKTGKWIHGYYLKNRGIDFIAPDEFANGKTWQDYEVIPETVGQFTGLLDNNGKEISEGDIMRIPETEFNIEIIGVVEFDRGSYVVRSFFSGTHSCLAWAVRERQLGVQRSVVIGNIHDNPELLKTETL